MSPVDAIILGIIQGLTEFLPVSSSAHLLFAQELLGLGPQTKSAELTFDVALHGGTLLAIIVYFWRDILNLIGAGLASIRDRSIANDPQRRLAWYLVLATIPGALFGGLFEKTIEESLRAPWIAAVALIVLGIFLFLAERIGRQSKSIRRMTLGDALIIGVLQAAALIPGVSRSGVTITAGLFRDLERDDAARFSFLLAGPLTAGAVVLKVGKLLKAGIPADERLALILGVASAAVVGLFAISFLLKYLRTHTTYVFILYRILLGLTVLIYFFGFMKKH